MTHFEGVIKFYAKKYKTKKKIMLVRRSLYIYEKYYAQLGRKYEKLRLKKNKTESDKDTMWKLLVEGWELSEEILIHRGIIKLNTNEEVS